MIFTFGFGHECSCGLSLRSCYTVLEDKGAVTARERMFALWGVKWSFAYATELEAGVERWGLHCVETNEDDPHTCRCGGTARQPWVPL